MLGLAARELERAGDDIQKAAVAAWYSRPAILFALGVMGDKTALEQAREYRRELHGIMARLRPASGKPCS